MHGHRLSGVDDIDLGMDVLKHVLQHAPARLEYDGFPGDAMHPIEREIEALELISERPVVAITLNHEEIEAAEIPAVCDRLSSALDLPVFDVLRDGADGLAALVAEFTAGGAHR